MIGRAAVIEVQRVALVVKNLADRVEDNAAMPAALVACVRAAAVELQDAADMATDQLARQAKAVAR